MGEAASPRQKIPLPARLLWLAAALSVALLIGLGCYVRSSERAIASIEGEAFHTFELLGAARLALESRMEAARIGVVSESPRWRILHAGFQSDWDRAMKALQPLAPSELGADAGRNLMESAASLLALEQQAFQLAGQSKREAAVLLSSEPYHQHQMALSHDAERISGWLRDRVKTALDTERLRARLAANSFAAAFPLVLCLGIFAARLTLRDARAGRLATGSLRESEHRLRTLFEGIEDAVIVHDLHGIILDCNAAACRRLGYTREELLTLRASDIETAEFAAGFAQRCARQLASGVYVWEGAHRTRDGRRIPVDINSRVITYHNSPAIVATVRDITERKRVEVELEQMREAAEAANAAKSEFLANMSHEIRTPMNGVIGMTELTLGTELTAEQREYLQMAKSSADSLLTLINDILDFSKIEAGRLELETIEFGLRESLDDMMKALAVRARQKGLELSYRIAAEIPDRLLGDPGRLRQVLVNLVGNAIKFTNRGKVLVEVDAASLKRGKEIFRFRVTDTGIGIEPRNLKAIFEPFKQADGSTTRKYGGTGLGLAISSQLVGLMGGEIWAESEGKGSAFVFTAQMGVSDTPARPAESKVETITTSVTSVTLDRVGAFTGQPPGPGKAVIKARHILAAEDNLVNQRLLVRMLQKRGHTVVLTSNGLEAVEAYGRERFDIALFDIQMPEMSGLEATAAIRAKERERGAGSRIPIVAITANAMQGDRERCLAGGMDAYLAKPIQQGELFEMVENMPIIQEPSALVHFDGALFDGDPEFLAEIVNLFLATCPELLSNVETAVARQDADAVCRAAHTLKGAVANFGAEAAVEQAKKLEMIGKSGDVSQAAEVWGSLRGLVEALQPELEAALEKATEKQVST